MKSLLILLGFFILTSCGTPSTPIINKPILPEPLVEEPKIELLEPIETRAPNTEFTPGFEGQTRAPGTRTQADYSYSIINTELVSPWGIDVLPDGTLLITEKQGSLAVLDPDGTILMRLDGFPRLNPDGQGGLLDIAISPDFENDSTIYFTFSSQTNQGNATALGRAKLDLSNKVLKDVETLFVADPYLSGVGHYGSRIVFDQDGNIFLSTGDRQETERRLFAQDPNHNLGKIHYLTKDGDVVSGYSITIYSLGHRNVQGIAIHPETQALWANEMGPQGGDELNLIELNKNYGWPIVSYGEEYSGTPIGDGITQKEGMTEPRYYWDPVIAPSGMIFYTGEMFSEWKNNLFIGGLKAEGIVRVILDGDKVLAEEHILTDEKQRIRDLAQGIDGSLYAITDSGRLYIIRK